MSLINEALKKAERERALEKAEGTAPPHGGRTRVAKRGAPMRTQTVLTIAAGALLLVVVSAVLTGVFVTRKVETKPAPKPAGGPVAAPLPPVLIVANIPSAPAAQHPAAGTVGPPNPATKAEAGPAESFTPSAFRAETAGPSNALAVSAAAIVANLPAVGNAPAPATAEPSPPSASSPPAVRPTVAISGAPGAPLPAAQPPAAPAQANQAQAATPRHDPRIQALVDGFHVTGIRSNGTDSKVLMNERVFRVNDIVDYGFGLKLTTVAPDRLTFVDASGETYMKNF